MLAYDILTVLSQKWLLILCILSHLHPRVGQRDGEAVNSGVKGMSWAARSLGVKPGSATCSLCQLSRLRFPSL